MLKALLGEKWPCSLPRGRTDWKSVARQVDSHRLETGATGWLETSASGPPELSWSACCVVDPAHLAHFRLLR